METLKTLDELAIIFNVSRRTIQRKIKKLNLTGTTIKNVLYFNDFDIEKLEKEIKKI